MKNCNDSVRTSGPVNNKKYLNCK